MLQSRNDTGDKITDHSTLQRLVFMWRQLSLPDMCSRIDLHSFLFASFRKQQMRWRGMGELETGSLLKCKYERCGSLV